MPLARERCPRQIRRYDDPQLQNEALLQSLSMMSRLNDDYTCRSAFRRPVLALPSARRSTKAALNAASFWQHCAELPRGGKAPRCLYQCRAGKRNAFCPNSKRRSQRSLIIHKESKFDEMNCLYTQSFMQLRRGGSWRLRSVSGRPAVLSTWRCICGQPVSSAFSLFIIYLRPAKR